ncbi:MAG: ATP-dependent protease [Deltaproteobacteria bacterium]|nr:MAG: ATP-dependent protease [Deltaproteobacteria bacterium]
MCEKFFELPFNELRATIDPASIPFENTASLEPLGKGVIGQERGVDAIQFGIGLKENGYNVFVVGPPKAGLTYITRTFLEERVKQEPAPPDWCYVYNFKEPDKPKSLRLRAGLGNEFKRSMDKFIKTVRSSIQKVFDSDDYRVKEEEVTHVFETKRREILDELSQTSEKEGFVVQFSQVGMYIIPADKKGQPISKEELKKLSKEERNALHEKSDELKIKLQTAMKQIREAEGEYKEKHTKLDRDVALFVVENIMENFFNKYKDESSVVEFLNACKEDIIDNLDDFKEKQEEQQAGPFPMPVKMSGLRRYEVNLLIDNSDSKGAPVVIESNPAYPNLFGTIERQAWFGALVTDFTMIKPGALHKANGGYLVIKALDLLKWPLSYEALKRSLGQKEIKIEDVGELFGMISTRTIRPEPIPLDIKIILTGDSYIYQLLYIYDDRFQKFFKVKAHLDDRMERKEDSLLQFARMISRYCSEQKIRHVDHTGIARILEYSMELTEDREKLSLELGDISNLLKEANYFAGLDNSELIQKKHVEKTIKKRIYRCNLIEENVKELVKKDILWVETKGEKVGQVNGLSILTTGDHEFGKPGRITATVSVGREGVVTIDRESKLSGKIHTKGVMILTNFLRERFAQNKPISLTASLCFEQSYGMVEGDSASSTELYALLSALSGLPVKQGIAVTGSVSQKGEIQPVGGVTKKIEGFFDICNYKGLTGDQGVIIPEKNIRNLMLKQEVVDAVKDGQFHIWPVSTIEEGMEILSGIKAGNLQTDGTYEDGTLFRSVDERLQEIADIVRDFLKKEKEESKENEGA